MDIKDLMTLANAGFTKEEILNLARVNTPGDKKDVPVNNDSDLVAEIRQLRETMQARNIQSMGVIPPATNPADDVTSILIGAKTPEVKANDIVNILTGGNKNA